MPEVFVNRTTHIAFPDVNTAGYDDITSGIDAGSLLLDEVLMSGNMNLGEINSNKFEVQLYNISDVSGQKIVVWQTEPAETQGDPDEVIPIFVGYVDSCKQDVFGHYREIVAYDELYSKAAVNVSSWWEDLWAEDEEATYTIAQLRESLLEYVGLTLSSDTPAALPNDEVPISKQADVATLTFGDILKMLCELQMVFPNMNREGELELVSLSATSQATVTDNVDVGGSSFEEFTTQPIDAVWIYDASPVVVGTGGEGTTNVYKIQGNIIAYGIGSTYLATVAESIYNTISQYTYKPADLAFIVSDFSRKLGQRVTFSAGQTYIFENHYSGSVFIEESIKANGDQYLQEKSSFSTDILELKKQIEASQYYIKTYTNARDIEIGDDTQKVILNIRLATAGNVFLTFNAEIPMTVTLSSGSTKCVVTAHYTMDGVEIPYNPKESYDLEGDHLLHLMYLIPSIQQSSARWLVLLEAVGGTIEIGAQQIQGFISGVGMLAEPAWDGTITIDESVAAIPLHEITVASNLRESVVVAVQVPTPIVLSETISSIPLRGIDVAGIDDEVSFDGKQVQAHVDESTASVMTYNRNYVTINNHNFILKTEYAYMSTVESIDSGSLSKVTVDTTGFDDITSISIDEDS